MSSWLYIGGALAVVGSSMTAYFTMQSGAGPFGRVLRAYEARLERHASFLLLSYRGAQIARAQLLGATACVALLSLTQHPAFALVGLLVALVPPFFLWKRHAARVLKLERQLDAWLLMLANALKSTPSVSEAIASTAPLSPRPFGEEVDLLIKEIRLGVSIDRSLNSLARRIGSNLVSGALMMIAVAQQTGGDLSKTLERASAALRESARLEGVLRTKTAEGRGQVLVLALAPFVLCIVITWLDRSWFDPMLHHPHGRGILAGCALAWTVATVWAHHIVGTEL